MAFAESISTGPLLRLVCCPDDSENFESLKRTSFFELSTSPSSRDVRRQLRAILLRQDDTLTTPHALLFFSRDCRFNDAVAYHEQRCADAAWEFLALDRNKVRRKAEFEFMTTALSRCLTA